MLEDRIQWRALVKIAISMQAGITHSADRSSDSPEKLIFTFYSVQELFSLLTQAQQCHRRHKQVPQYSPSLQFPKVPPRRFHITTSEI